MISHGQARRGGRLNPEPAYDRAVAAGPSTRSSGGLAQLTHARPALAGLAATAGAIHLVIAIEEAAAGDWARFVFPALVGIGLLAIGSLIYRGAAGEHMLKLAALASVAIALLWVFSRTTGLPLGPDAGTAAQPGIGDTIATLLELTFAALVALIAWRGEQPVAWLSSAIGIRLMIAVLSMSVLLAAFGGHEH